MKYGLKAILRAPLKTAFFLLLIAAVTAFLSLGIGLWQSAEGMLAEADAVFKTAGEFVYTGGNYPDDMAHDPSLQEAAAAFDSSLFTRPEVLAYEQNYLMRAFIPDYAPKLSDMPYGSHVVLSLTVQFYDEQYGAYSVLINAVQYTSSQHLGLAAFIYEPEDFPLEPGKRYMLVGQLVTVRGHNYNGIKVAVPESLDISVPSFPFITEYDPALGVQGAWETDAGQYYAQIAGMLKAVNGSADVLATGDITAVSQFHRGEYTLIDGHYFTEAEQRSGTACIIPRRIASRFGLEIGGTIELSVIPPAASRGRYGGYDAELGYLSVQQYTVAGIYDTEEYTSPIYIPDAGQTWLYHSGADYILGRVVLRSRDAAAFIAALDGTLPDGVRFEVNDQGYAAAVRPILAVRSTAMLITAVCAAACVLILWFFGFFFVYRSRETARILLALGTGSGGIVRFFLTGSGVITILSSAGGAAGGFFALRRVFDAVMQAAERDTVRDARFSGYGIKSDAYQPVFNSSVLWFMLAAAGIFLAALIICACFTGLMIRSQNPRVLFRRRKKHDKKRGQSAMPKRPVGAGLILPTAALRYSVRSILRGGKRSLTVPVLFAAFLIFLALFDSVRDGYQERLDTVYTDIPVTLRVTDISGRKLDNLVFYDKDLDAVEEQGFTQSVWSSANFRSEPPVKTIVSEWDETVGLSGWSWSEGMSDFQIETFENQLRYTTDPFIVTDDLAHAPEFFYTGLPDIKFADGLDWDYFTVPEEAVWNEDNIAQWYASRPHKTDYILVSRAYADAYGLSPGDDVSLNIFSPSGSWTYICRIGGVFDTGNSRKTVYCFNQSIRNTVQDELVREYVFGQGSEVYIEEDEEGRRILYATDRYDGAPKMLDIITEDSLRMYGMENEAELIQHYLDLFANSRGFFLSDYTYKSTLNAGGALLQSTERLSEFKDWLAGRYDQLGKAGNKRRWVIIDDTVLYDTIENLTRHIGYMDMLTPVIFTLVAVMGFLISNLLLKSRTREIGILRGIGASRKGIFISLLLEQMTLSLPGLLAGVLIPVYCLFTDNYWNAGIFTACYFTGAIFAILHTFRDKAIKNLARREE